MTTQQETIISEEQETKNTRQNVVGGYNLDKWFPIVEASKLSTKDKFLKHNPRTPEQKKFKEELVEVIREGIHDFRTPLIAPSFDTNGNIYFAKGKTVGGGISPKEWQEKALRFMPEKKSRIGTRKEYIALLGVIIKDFVEKHRFKVREAWEIVCDNSFKLEQYFKPFERGMTYKPTGSGRVGRWYDLVTNRKIIQDEKTLEFRNAGGCYAVFGNFYSLAWSFVIQNPKDRCFHSVALIVLEV